MNGLAQLHRVEGNLDLAEPLYEQAIALARDIGDRETWRSDCSTLRWCGSAAAQARARTPRWPKPSRWRSRSATGRSGRAPRRRYRAGRMAGYEHERAARWFGSRAGADGARPDCSATRPTRRSWCRWSIGRARALGCDRFAGGGTRWRRAPLRARRSRKSALAGRRFATLLRSVVHGPGPSTAVNSVTCTSNAEHHMVSCTVGYFAAVIQPLPFRKVNLPK